MHRGGPACRLHQEGHLGGSQGQGGSGYLAGSQGHTCGVGCADVERDLLHVIPICLPMCQRPGRQERGAEPSVPTAEDQRPAARRAPGNPLIQSHRRRSGDLSHRPLGKSKGVNFREGAMDEQQRSAHGVGRGAPGPGPQTAPGRDRRGRGPGAGRRGRARVHPARRHARTASSAGTSAKTSTGSSSQATSGGSSGTSSSSGGNSSSGTSSSSGTGSSTGTGSSSGQGSSSASAPSSSSGSGSVTSGGS